VSVGLLNAAVSVYRTASDSIEGQYAFPQLTIHLASHTHFSAINLLERNTACCMVMPLPNTCRSQCAEAETKTVLGLSGLKKLSCHCRDRTLAILLFLILHTAI